MPQDPQLLYQLLQRTLQGPPPPTGPAPTQAPGTGMETTFDKGMSALRGGLGIPGTPDNPYSRGGAALAAALPFAGPVMEGLENIPNVLKELFTANPGAIKAYQAAQDAQKAEAAEAATQDTAALRRLNYLMKKTGVPDQPPTTTPEPDIPLAANQALNDLNAGTPRLIPTETGVQIPIPNKPIAPISAAPPSTGGNPASRFARRQTSKITPDMVRAIRAAGELKKAASLFPDISEGSLREILNGGSFNWVK